MNQHEMTESRHDSPWAARRRVRALVIAALAICGIVAASPADGQQPAPYPYGVPSSPSVSTPTPPQQAYPQAYPIDPQGDPSYAAPTDVDPALVPPDVEEAPRVAQPGGYCYVGPHPVDTRISAGPAWDPTEGQHIRPYPPIDTRLFAVRDGCYYFTGDPRDFGYAGNTYSYYGAHPVLATYGGGWCFMMGGHAHLWRPWSPYFTVVGSWNYWRGPYDPFFWTYWPYYSVYYRSYYPHFYGGGRFYRGGGHRVAPPIRAVPTSAWRGATPGQTPFGRAAPVTRGTPPSQMYRPSPAMGGPPRGGFGPPPNSNRMGMGPGPNPSFAPRGGPAFSPGPRPSFSPGPRPSFSPGPHSGGPSHGGFGGPRGGGRR